MRVQRHAGVTSQHKLTASLTKRGTHITRVHRGIVAGGLPQRHRAPVLHEGSTTGQVRTPAGRRGDRRSRCQAHRLEAWFYPRVSQLGQGRLPAGGEKVFELHFHRPLATGAFGRRGGNSSCCEQHLHEAVLPVRTLRLLCFCRRLEFAASLAQISHPRLGVNQASRTSGHRRPKN